MCEKKKAGGVLFRSWRVSHQPSPARLSAMQQQPQVSAEKQPRLQSARWPGLGASSSGSLRKSANPREEKRGFRTWPTSEEAQTRRAKASKTISLDSSVACECATDGKLGEEEARREMGKRHVFFLFLVPDPAVGKKKEQSDNAALSQVCPLRIYGAMYAFFWGRGGIRITTRIRSSTRGADFSAPRISQQSVIKFSTGGDWVTGERERAHCRRWPAKLGPSGRAGGRAWSSGETKVKSGCGCGFAGFLSRGRCEASGPMGGSRPLIEEGRPMWCEGNCDVV